MIFQSSAGKEWGGHGLARALAVSIALHILLLWPALQPFPRPQAAQPLAATLRAAAAPERQPAAAIPAAQPIAQRQRSRNVLHRLPDGKPDVAAQPAVPQVAAAVEPTNNLTAYAGASAVQGGSIGPAPAAGAPAPDAGSLDADGIRAYRIGLARGARAHKRYPGIAQERGWAGTAEVRVAVSREGRLRQVLLARSSGYDVLDGEAVAMMSRAAAAAAVPESLRGREFAVSLPVVFDLAEQQ